MAMNVKSIFQTQTYRFNWTIENFLNDSVKVGDFYASPEFSILHYGKVSKWYLRIYPKSAKEESKDYTSVFLCRLNDEETEVTLVYQISIEAVSERNILFRSRVPQTFVSGGSWGKIQFVKQDVIMDPKNGILIDGALTLSCELKFLPLTQDATGKLEAYSILMDKIGKGLGDYEQLLKTNQFADVTFIVQGQQIRLNKVILMCRNPVFKAMLETPTQDRKGKLTKNPITIKDVDYEVMLEVFRFIYAGKVKNIDKIVKKLLVAADKYAVDELKALCELTLAKNLSAELTVDNILEYLELIDKCDTAHLKTPVINFAVRHYGEVIEKPAFQDLSNNVMYAIMQQIKPAF